MGPRLGERAPFGAAAATGRLYKPPKRRLWVHIALFCATVATTSLFVSPLYSLCVLVILTAHEFGHYLAARHYRVPATLPYFIPAPFLFGTMGAVIRMSPYIPHRKALFDIAAAGPFAGVVFAIPMSLLGIVLSERVAVEEAGAGITLGDPLLFKFFERIAFGPAEEGTVLMLHDIGFAGWVGLFVTALNLLPVGQLDGGHVSYSVLGRRSTRLAILTFLALLAVSLATGLQYTLLLIMLFLFGLRHPPTMADHVPLGRARRRLAFLLVVVFVLCFVPVPIEFPDVGNS